MDTLTGPAVVLDGTDCEILGRQLIEAIRLGWTARGVAPPERLLDLANQVSIVARSSARFRAGTQASAARNLAEPAPARPGPRSGQELVLLTATEAARIAEVSASYMRRMFRRGSPRAERGPRSAWQVDAADLDAWLSERRSNRPRKAA